MMMRLDGGTDLSDGEKLQTDDSQESSESPRPGAQRETNPNQSMILLVPTRVLLLIAAAAYFTAGSIVTSQGIKASTSTWSWWMLAVYIGVFVVFLALFISLSKRNINRILTSKPPLAFVLSFFDTNSYMIMAVMMFLGAAVRISTFVPDTWIAAFYSGLGSALVLSGFYPLVCFITNWSSPHFE